MLDDRLARLELSAGGRSAGERHDVLAVNVIEQVTGRADDQLQCAIRKYARLDHRSHHRFRQVRRDGRRLHDRRHSTEECRGELLEHSPAGEVEGVDVDGSSLEGNADVTAYEGVV